MTDDPRKRPLPHPFAPGYWNEPFFELRRLQKALDQMLTEDFPEHSPQPHGTPKVEIHEDEHHYHFRFDLPGVSKENIQIEVSDGALIVRAERHDEKKSDDNRQHLSEIQYGSFIRSLPLPKNVLDSEVKASFENGVLSVTIPKSGPLKTKPIEIE